MKPQPSFKDAFKQCQTVSEVLKQMAMSQDHAWVKKHRSIYAMRMVQLITNGLSSNGRGTRPPSPAAIAERVNKELADRGGLFPYTKEQSPREETEKLLAAIERALPIVGKDDDGNVFTIREAWASSSIELLEKAVSTINTWADAQQKQSDHALRVLAAVHELFKRKNTNGA